MNAFASTNASTRGAVFAVAVAFMLVEYVAARLARRDTHDLRESAASFGIAVGQALLRVVEAGVLAMPFVFVFAHRLFDFDSTGPLALVGLFVATEFVYYWHHRASHRIRWMWATHAVHHSATRLNFTAAIRLGWTGNLTGSFVFFLPLVWLGFDPRLVVAMLGLNLLYQFFVHTELVPTLGPLEWVLNTPAQHRVHHASNDACIDRNFGGVLSVFDRLFGTFATAPVDEPLRYGLAGREPTSNPLRIAFGEWLVLARDLRASRGWAASMRELFGPPRSGHDTAPRVASKADDSQTHGHVQGVLR